MSRVRVRPAKFGIVWLHLDMGEKEVCTVRELLHSLGRGFRTVGPYYKNRGLLILE
jgi:hypothetical protein